MLSPGQPNSSTTTRKRARSSRARSAKRSYVDLDDEQAFELSAAKNVPWTEEEDFRLNHAIKRYGEHAWTKISINEFASQRNSQQCRQRWSKVVRPGIKKGTWSRNEDLILTTAIEQVLLINQVPMDKIQWNSVAMKVPNRTYAMCRERWKNHLDPSINHSEFSQEEQLRLEQLYTEYGNKVGVINDYRRPDLYIN
jgi:myb proto-oncogene protein